MFNLQIVTLKKKSSVAYQKANNGAESDHTEAAHKRISKKSTKNRHEIGGC